MSIIESIIYGLISGLTEFIPVSSRAHQIILRYIFGANSRNFLQEFLVHIGILLSILVSCREYISRLRREVHTLTLPRGSKKLKSDSSLFYDLKLLKTAAIALTFCSIVILFIFKTEGRILSVAGLLILNAVILLLAAHSQYGNRDARTMSALDGVVMGILGCLSVFPGISRIGIISSYTTLRGVDYRNSINWVVVLSIPAIILLCLFDIIGVIGVGIGNLSFISFIGYFLSGVSAFLGGYIAVSVLFAILTYYSFSYFAYYSLGVSLFSFILYLIT